MTKVWHEEPFVRDAYRLVDKDFVKSLKTFSLFEVSLGAAGVWAQIIIGLILPFISLWLLPLSLIIITSVQQQMGSWVHEASHSNLFRSKRINDLWTSFWFGAPIGMNLQRYRAGHLTHHAYLSSDKDMDVYVHSYNLNGANFWYETLRVALCYHGFSVAIKKYVGPLIGRGNFASTTSESDPAESSGIEFLVMAAAWNGAYFLICVFSGMWYLYFLTWLYPLFSFTQGLNILRTTAEHQPEGFPAESVADNPLVRTTVPGPLERWFLYGVNFNYHLEHHLWPTVPFFNLPKLHKHLVAVGFYDLYPHLRQESGILAVWQRTRLEPLRQMVPLQ